MGLQKRKLHALIVDDETAVHGYAIKAFRGFDQTHAFSVREARLAFVQQEPENRFSIVSCDINMPRGQPDGLELMKWFHALNPELPIICHSDDPVHARQLSFATFVEKCHSEDEVFNADEAFLRAAVLDILFGKQSFWEEIVAARNGRPLSQEPVFIPDCLRQFLEAAKTDPRKYLGDVFRFARAGPEYLDRKLLIEVIRQVILKAPEFNFLSVLQ